MGGWYNLRTFSSLLILFQLLLVPLRVIKFKWKAIATTLKEWRKVSAGLDPFDPLMRCS